MKKINVLIVDDSLPSCEITMRGIRKFNAQTTDYELIVMEETDNSEDGIEFIKNEKDFIRLVFLDYNLPGKNGFCLSRQFPNIAYLVVSSEPNILKIISEEKRNYQHQYMEHISEGYTFDSDDIVIAIQKCLNTYMIN